MDRVTLSIDGQAVTAPPGSSVLDAAAAAGIRIPSLCHHPGLAPHGACRLCVVEDMARGALLASCVTPVRDGLKVLTSSERVLAARREVLSLIMASHPESCIVCDQGNRCELRSLAAELGLGNIDLYRIPYLSPTTDRNPILMRDMAKCVMCGRCVRADHEVVVRGALDYSHRGFEARPTPLLDGSLVAGGCTLCGTCETVCPTGAIYEIWRPLKHHGAERTPTVCWLCGCGCAVWAASDHASVVGIEPDLDRSPAGIALCVRGHYGYDHLTAPGRLVAPLIRRGTELVEASWDEALDQAAQGLREIAIAQGPGATGVIGGSRGTVQEAYLLQRLARAGLATPNVDSGARLDAAVALEALAEATGWPGGAGSLADLDQADLILLWGADPDEEAPAAAYAIRRAIRQRGCRVVSIGPVRPHLARLGAQWIPAVGTGLAGVAAALAHNLLVLAQAAPERLPIEVPEGLRARARAWRSAALPSERWELDGADGNSAGSSLAAQVDGLAQALTRAQRCVVVCGRQLAGSPAARAASRWIVNVALMTGAEMMVLSGDPNARGAVEMGLSPGLLPGGVRVGAPGAAAFAQAWGNVPPASAGLSYPQMIAAAREGRLAGLLVVGENPVRALPGTGEVLQAIRALEHLVVIDTFLGETASEATVVLPAAAATERSGALVNLEGRLQAIREVVPPPGEARPESWILAELGRRLGAPPPGEPGALETEISGLVPARDLAHSDGLQQPSRSAALLVVSEPPTDFHPAEAPADGVLALVVTASPVHAGSGTRTASSARLRALSPAPRLRLNPGDAEAAGLSGRDRALLMVGDRRLGVSFEANAAVPPGVAAISAGPEVWDLLPLVIDPSGAGPCTVVEGVRVRAPEPGE